MSEMKKAILIIIDGWGIRSEKKGNAIALARTPHYNEFLKTYPNGRLEASGLSVGLPDGVMGNSEVGHMNIGAGRRVLQDQVRIHESIDDETFFQNENLRKEIQRTAQVKKNLHLIGLVSQGNVHSAERHYLALVDFCQKERFPMDQLFVHAVLDGRDTPPKSATEYLSTLQTKLQEKGGRIASVSGRFFTMDRDKRWERVDQAYKALVLGEGNKAKSAMNALDAAYSRNETDEFVTPTVITGTNGNPLAKIESGDGVICFNFRPDRMREIVRALTNNEAPIPSLQKNLKVSLVMFTQYDKTFPQAAAFPPTDVKECIGEVISMHNSDWQFRTAETEKYAHVTYFLNGGREQPFDREERLLIPSPKVKTYDLTPQMSSKAVMESVINRATQEKDRLIVVNFAHPDMVGHTGIFEAAVEAVESTDHCMGEIFKAAQDHKFNLFITADHGNVEMMVDPVTGQPHTAHTLNPVPFIAIGPELKKQKMNPTGALCDVAPTVLYALGLNTPVLMTGKNLLKK